jgi:hypothetical protein
LVDNHSAQAMFRNIETFRLQAETDMMSVQKAGMAEVAPLGRHVLEKDDHMTFSPAPTVRTLCTCGSVVEVDRNVVRTKRNLGKAVECRRCRTARIALEKAELDLEFFGIQEDGS